MILLFATRRIFCVQLQIYVPGGRTLRSRNASLGSRSVSGSLPGSLVANW